MTNVLGIGIARVGSGNLNLPATGDMAWQRVTRATATLPQGTAGTLFNVTGGRVLIVALVGEVTTAIQNQANDTKIVFDPTATGASQDLCAVLNIANDAVGEMYTISGTVSDAMRSDLLIGNPVLGAPIIVSEGAINLDCAASNTGSVAWDLWYLPMDTGATVAAA